MPESVSMCVMVFFTVAVECAKIHCVVENVFEVPFWGMAILCVGLCV